MRSARRIGLMAAALLACAGARAWGPARVVSDEERRDLIRRAHVWHPVPVEKMDTLDGPQADEESFRSKQDVHCAYEEKDPLRPLGGHTKKFPCWDALGYRLKIKYDPMKNPEVVAEVAGARLLWALGFYAEKMYSVRLVVDNAPEDPWVSDKTPRKTRVFDPASIQKRLPGEEIRPESGEGWTLEELDQIDPSAGGSPRAEVDAFKLLVVFMNHGDNTPNQQRLLCYNGDIDCRRPIMYVTDIGSVFGGKNYDASFREWAKKKSLWKDPKACVADFEGASAFRDPKISEAGRKFLADLLNRLSDQQIRDIFIGARFDVFDQLDYPVVGADGKARKVTIDDWVRVFKEKREEIASVRCPE